MLVRLRSLALLRYRNQRRWVVAKLVTNKGENFNLKLEI